MWKSIMQLAIVAMAAAVAVSAQEFGYSTTSDEKRWVINSGDGLAITMTRATCDIVSINYKNQELQYKAKSTHIGSGLGNVNSSIATLEDANNTIQITCEKTGLTQYYFFRPQENAIYMGTYHTSELPLGELRFLARLDRATVPTGIPASTLDGTTRAIEATDVYATDSNVTYSKYYSGVPFIYDQIHGVRGPKAGVYFVMSPLAYETSISGPFYRDINNQCGTANELTFYMNSDHTRTEEYRFGFHGPYALVLNDGPAPDTTDVVDFSFFQDQDLRGFVPDDQRGRVQGVIHDPNAVLANYTVVVGFKNSEAQYWTEVKDGETSYVSPSMKEGTYTMTVYRKQFVVATGTVEITMGETLTQDIAVTYSESDQLLWRIGEWDGTPEGFLNADKINTMHPSDARMAPWVPTEFTVGLDDDSAFPLALFRGVNDPLTIVFDLNEDDASQPRVLRIGISLAHNNGRTTVRVNDKWSGPVPATAAVKTRGITRGTTTGNYVVYEYTIPSSALVVGTNRIALGIASGNADPEQRFLRANVVFDALELV